MGDSRDPLLALRPCLSPTAQCRSTTEKSKQRSDFPNASERYERYHRARFCSEPEEEEEEEEETTTSSFSMMTAQIAATSGGCAMMGAVAPGNALSSARSWKRRRQLSLRKSDYEVMRRKRSSGSEDNDSATFSERFLSVSQRILESIRSFKI